MAREEQIVIAGSTRNPSFERSSEREDGRQTKPGTAGEDRLQHSGLFRASVIAGSTRNPSFERSSERED
ncbi:MAG: hypothetical protein Q9M13_04880, partial [Mariprofundales bacterium]|nr:hypothetical protein [Mariprofundales bacterium]